MQPSAAQIRSRSSSRTLIGLCDHTAATLLNDGVNPTSANAFCSWAVSFPPLPGHLGHFSPTCKYHLTGKS